MIVGLCHLSSPTSSFAQGLNTLLEHFSDQWPILFLVGQPGAVVPFARPSLWTAQIDVNT